MTAVVVLGAVLPDVMPFVIIGIVAGSLYGLAAAGLVLTYQTSGVFNFAHGAVGAATAFCFFDLRDRQGLPAWVAFVASVGIAAPLLGAGLSRLGARLVEASTARRVVATVGVLLAVQGIIQLRYGAAPATLDTMLPTSTFTVADVAVGYDQLLTTAIAVFGVLGLAVLLRTTPLGLKMRGVVDNPDLISLGGDDPSSVQATSWALGSAFAGLSGVLLAPAVGLDALTLTLVVVQAFGAAALGRFESTTGAFLGGVVIGIVANVLNAPVIERNVPFLEQLPTLDTSLPFLVLTGVLLLAPRGAFRDRAVKREPRVSLRVPASAVRPLAVGTVLVAVMLPQLYETRTPVFTLGAVFVTIFASLYLLVEVSNQVSLCQVTFVAIGATTFSHVTVGAGMPWAVGVVAAALVAVPIGALVAVPAIRLSGLFLALATLGFGILVEQLVYSRGLMFGAFGRRSGARPLMLGLDGDTQYFYLCVAVGVAAIAAVVLIRRSRLGRLLNALADSPVALATTGTSVNITRVLVFCISASMAGVGGALLVGVTGSVSSSGASSSALISFNSLLWLVTLAVVGRNVLVAPVLAAIALVVAPSYLTNPDTAQMQTLVFGAIAVTVATFGPDISTWLRDSAERDRGRVMRGPVRERTLKATLGGIDG